MVRHLFHKALLCLLLLIAGWSISAQNKDYQRFKKNWEYLQQFYSPDEHAIFQVLDTMEKAAPQPYKGVYNFLIAQCLWQEMPYHANGNGQPRDGLTIQRTLMHPVSNESSAEPVTEKNPARIGERITVRLVINSDRELEYVHVEDPHAAAFEPVNIHERRSRYGWVESPRDEATHFFLDRLPQGITIIEYDLFATQEGIFSLGATTVECMYAPAHSAHTGGEKVTVLKP